MFQIHSIDYFKMNLFGSFLNYSALWGFALYTQLVKNPPAMWESWVQSSWILGMGRSAGEGIGYPLWYSWISGGSAGKESACSVGDLASILGLGRSPGERNGYPLQYSGLENSSCKEYYRESEFKIILFELLIYE